MMTETKSTLNYPDIKSLLKENDKRIYEYILNDKDENLFHGLCDTFSLILAIVEAANASKDTGADIAGIRQIAFKEAEKLIDIEISFEDRLAMLERKYLQARDIRIRSAH